MLLHPSNREFERRPTRHLLNRRCPGPINVGIAARKDSAELYAALGETPKTSGDLQEGPAPFRMARERARAISAPRTPPMPPAAPCRRIINKTSVQGSRRMAGDPPIAI